MSRKTHADERGPVPRSSEAGLFRTVLAISWYHATRGASPRGLDEEELPPGQEGTP